MPREVVRRRFTGWQQKTSRRLGGDIVQSLHLDQWPSPKAFCFIMPQIWNKSEVP